MRPPSEKVPSTRSRPSRKCWALWQLGLLHMRPIQFWLKQRVPSAAWRHSHHRITVTRACVSALTRWRDPLWLKQGMILDTAHRRKVVTTDASNKGWGALCEGKPTFGLWSEEESGSAHQLPRNASSVPCLSFLPTGHKGTPCANTLRQQVRGAIHKSPGRPRLEAPLHAGERPSCLGSDQYALTEDDACAGQNEPRSGHVVKEQRLLRKMDAPPARGSENLGSLWQILSRPICLRRQLSLPKLFHEEHGCPGPRVAQPPALCVPSNRSATAGTQTSQGTTAQASSNSPTLEEPAVGVGVIPAARSSPVAHSLETGPPLSSERHAVASTAQVMGPACMAAQREPFDLPEHVLNNMAEARAPSTRRLYALKWSIFLAWWQDRDLDPVTSDVSVVLHFCRRCWINSVPHPPSRFTQQPLRLSMPLLLADRWTDIVRWSSLCEAPGE